MKFFIYSTYGDTLFLVPILEQEGNDVTFCLADPNPKSKGVMGKGIARKLITGIGDRRSIQDVASFIKSKVSRDTVIVFDMVSTTKIKSGPVADQLRNEGYPVVGASGFADAIELNRTYGAQVMRMAGIDIPSTASFVDFKEAIKFARDHPKFLVFKAHGNLGESRTLVADNVDEFVADLELQQRLTKGSIEFELQEKVDGVECSVEGWFNGDDWIFQSFNSTIEEKRFMNGGLGANTGCMGNVVWFWRHARPKIVRETLLKLTSILRKANYRGPLDINTKGGKGLEFTARFGYDAIQTAYHLLGIEMGRLLSDIARGSIRRLSPSFDFAAGVRVSIPPYPIDHKPEDVYGTMVEVPNEVMPWFHPNDLQVEDERLVVSGDTGSIGLVTAVSKSLGELDQMVYNRVKKIKAQDIQYRTDIISFRARKEIPHLLREVI